MRAIGRYIRTRRSPAFNGRSVYLDGVSDYIDLQGSTSPGFWRRAYSQDQTNPYNRSMSWSIWVKFPQAEITSVISDYGGNGVWENSGNSGFSGGQISHWIIAQGRAHYGTISSPKFGGFHIGLVSNNDNKVYLATGWGRYNLNTQAGRVIRRCTTTEIVADTWYHIVVTFQGRLTSGSTDAGISQWINGVVQSQTPHYPYGISAGELTSTAHPYWVSTAHMETYIGRRGTQYTAMWVAEVAYWEGVALDANDVSTLYGGGTPLTDLTSNSGTYDKGDLEGANFTFNFISYGTGQKLTLVDYYGNSKIYEMSQDIPGNNGAILGNGNIGIDNIGASNQPGIAERFVEAVNHDNGHGYGLNTNAYQNIYASKQPFPSGEVTLELGTGGGDGIGSSQIGNGGGFDAVTDIDFSTAAFTGGSGSGQGVKSGLAGWWKLDGPRYDNASNQLHVSSKTVASSTEVPPDSGWITLTNGASVHCSNILVNASWTTDHPTST